MKELKSLGQKKSWVILIATLLSTFCIIALKAIGNRPFGFSLSHPQEVVISNSDILDLAYSPDGKKIIVLDQGNNSYLHLKILDASSVTDKNDRNKKISIKSVPEEENSTSKRIAFSPNSQWIAIATVNSWDLSFADQKITIREVNTQKIVHRMVIKGRPAVYSSIVQISYSPNGKYLLLADTVILRIWRTSDWKLIKSLNLKPPKAKGRLFTDIDAFDISPDSKVVATITKTYEVKLWNIETGLALSSNIPVEVIKRSSSDVFGYARIKFSRDGTKLLIMTSDYYSKTTIYLWDLVNNKLIQKAVANSLDVNVLTYSPDGRYFAINGSPPQVSLWSVSSLKKISSYVSGNSAYTDIEFSPDGKKIIASQNDKVKIWNINTSN